MADGTKPSAAQNKLGELFVDFGTKGLGTLVKGLNGISAQFLLTKNAAEQAIKPIVKMSKTAANEVVAFDKLNSVTGISISQLQKLKVWSELNNVSFSDFVGQIQNLQQKLLDIKLGRGMNAGFGILGLTPRDLDYNKPIEVLDKIRERVQQVDEASSAWAMKELGLSQDLLYAFRQNNTEFDTRLLLLDKEQQALREQQTSWNRLGATWDAAQQKFIANQSWINKLLQETIKWLEGAHPIIENISKSFDWLYTEGLPKMGEFIGITKGLATPDSLKYVKFDNFNQYHRYQELLRKNQEEQQRLEEEYNKKRANNNVKKTSEAPTTQTIVSKNIDNPFGSEAVSVPNSASSAIPAYLSPPPVISGDTTTNNSSSKNVTVNVTQNITGDNAQEIGRESANSIERTFIILEQSNLPNI